MQLKAKVVALPSVDPPEAQLARQAALGDRLAFQTLVRECEGMMYRMAWGLLGSDADAADATQEAIFKAWRSIGRLREPRWFKSWLVRILINECKQTLRRRRRQCEMPVGELPAPEHLSDEALDVRRAVRSLPEAQRAIVLLYYYNDFPIDAIARALRLPEGTVKSRLFAARKALRRLLEVDEA